jgi:hypothetical protein
VAGWDVIANVWDKMVRGAIAADPGSQVVSGDTEYFCPMDPGVLGDWPGTCPVCNMALVRRVRGDATPLPDGVLARMQLSPYRLQLAGIRTSPVAYRPLAREVEGPGRVRAVADSGKAAEVAVDLFAADLPGLAEGLAAEVAGASAEPLRATVRSVEAGDAPAVVLAVEDPKGSLRPGQAVKARVRVPMASLEPFRSLQAAPPPIAEGERRRAYVCDEHPDVVRERPGRCPNDDRELTRRKLDESERLRWWCPMHPDVTADAPGRSCEPCGGMALVPRVVHYAPQGQVLAVPESAVVDTGTRRVVYVERMIGMFDGVEVVLGPRCGDEFPVIRGLEPGQRVVSVGAFLVDAETRLNPSLAAGYFGASGRDPAATTPAPASGGSDASAIAAQKTCPVTGKPLGSMGPPFRVEVGGRVVFLCCQGCEGSYRDDPARYAAAPKPEP